MKHTWYRILTLIFLVAAVGGRAGADVNPYIAFYSEMVELAQLDVERLKVDQAYHLERKERLEEAWRSGAVPEATIMEIRRQVKVDAIELKSLEAKTRKADAQLSIVKLKVSAGEPVSMCGSGD